ncbi:amino acid decarboxylase, partial [Streptomyces sp. MMG1522]
AGSNSHPITTTPGLDLYQRPTISTVLFRPTGATDHTVATIRRTLLNRGHAILGRTHTAGHLWFKATLLNPHTTPHDLRTLLDLVTHATTELLTPTPQWAFLPPPPPHPA